MKLLDERGIGTVWSICKEKFALVGHTHNYAGSGSPGGSANSAIEVVDYNQTGKTIQIGYYGDGITGDQIKYIAGYTYGSGNVNAKIKDVSKDALKSWLGLSSFSLKDETVQDVSIITRGPSLETKKQIIKILKADGSVTENAIIEATYDINGLMSASDKMKLDGIASGANNYSLPTASAATLGGIKISRDKPGDSWPICVDGNGLAETKIGGLVRGDYNSIAGIAIQDSYANTYYSTSSISVNPLADENGVELIYPLKRGTFALLSDIPTKTSLLTNDSTFLTSADKYTLHGASLTTLGGIKTSYPFSPGDSWPIYASPNNKISTKIPGLHPSESGNIAIKDIDIQGESADTLTTYSSKEIIINSDEPIKKPIKFPSKAGTFALLSDIPDVSNLCKFNFINSISECKSDRINFLFRYPYSLIDLSPFDAYPDGTILIISITDNLASVKHDSGSWFYEGDEVSAGYNAYIYKTNLKLMTKYGGKVHYYSL